MERLWAAITWRNLQVIQRNFVSRAAIALPVVAFAVAIFPDWISEDLVACWRIQCVYWGSILFLIGQMVIWKYQPIEFGSEIDVRKEIELFRIMMDHDGFKNRLQLFSHMIARLRAQMPIGLSEAQLKIAELRLGEGLACDNVNWKDKYPLIEVSVRRLRDYDRPYARLAAFALIAFGVALLLCPIAANVIETGVRLGGAVLNRAFALR